MGTEILKSFLRHWGSMAAGGVVATGVASQDDSAIFVNVAIGLLLYGFSQGWSILRKVNRAKEAAAK